MKKPAPKQLIDKSEPYFVHIGFAMVHEKRKTKMRTLKNTRKWKSLAHKYKTLYVNLKTRPVVQKRIDKLERYWRMALK